MRRILRLMECECLFSLFLFEDGDAGDWANGCVVLVVSRLLVVVERSISTIPLMSD
jgi:hypothetical protein